MSDPSDFPLGAALPGWTPPPVPKSQSLDGGWVRLEPLDASAHAAELFDAFGEDTTGELWTYLGVGPFSDQEALRSWLAGMADLPDPMFFSVHARRTHGGPTLPASGVGSFLRITPVHGVIEIGHLTFAPRLQRTPAATEAISLMIDHAFGLGYRRVEWKCNALNGLSRRAAERYGFRYEGTFRQAMVMKGRNRDTAWFSILDNEWPALKAAHRQWLAVDNFDADGRQRAALSELTAKVLE